MKKYIPMLCLAVVTVLILLTAASRPYYSITRPYKCPYPVGSDEWIAIRENKSKIKGPDIDEQTAQKMSTEALILSYVEFPNGYRSNFTRHPRKIFESMVKSSVCLSTALGREDFIEALYRIYRDVRIRYIDYDNSSEQKQHEIDLHTDKIYNLETICSQLDLRNNDDKYASRLLIEIERTIAEMRIADWPYHSHFESFYVTPGYDYISNHSNGMRH